MRYFKKVKSWRKRTSKKNLKPPTYAMSHSFAFCKFPGMADAECVICGSNHLADQTRICENGHSVAAPCWEDARNQDQTNCATCRALMIPGRNPSFLNTMGPMVTCSCTHTFEGYPCLWTGVLPDFPAHPCVPSKFKEMHAEMVETKAELACTQGLLRVAQGETELLDTVQSLWLFSGHAAEMGAAKTSTKSMVYVERGEFHVVKVILPENEDLIQVYNLGDDALVLKVEVTENGGFASAPRKYKKLYFYDDKEKKLIPFDHEDLVDRGFRQRSRFDFGNMVFGGLWVHAEKVDTTTSIDVTWTGGPWRETYMCTLDFNVKDRTLGKFRDHRGWPFLVTAMAPDGNVRGIQTEDRSYSVTQIYSRDFAFPTIKDRAEEVSASVVCGDGGGNRGTVLVVTTKTKLYVSTSNEGREHNFQEITLPSPALEVITNGSGTVVVHHSQGVDVWGVHFDAFTGTPIITSTAKYENENIKQVLEKEGSLYVTLNEENARGVRLFRLGKPTKKRDGAVEGEEDRRLRCRSAGGDEESDNEDPYDAENQDAQQSNDVGQFSPGSDDESEIE